MRRMYARTSVCVCVCVASLHTSELSTHRAHTQTHTFLYVRTLGTGTGGVCTGTQAVRSAPTCAQARASRTPRESFSHSKHRKHLCIYFTAQLSGAATHNARSHSLTQTHTFATPIIPHRTTAAHIRSNYYIHICGSPPCALDIVHGIRAHTHRYST